MQKTIKYTIFKTKWGYFGFVGTEYAIWRTCLPLSKPEKVKRELLDILRPGSGRARYWILDTRRALSIEHRISRIEFDKNFFKPLQEQITAYFDGACVNFSRDIPVVLNGFSSFASLVLNICRDIKFGQKISYSALAKRLGQPNAARAVGNALSKNPLPLLIPCHRVIRSDGRIGGFSAPGGRKIKEKLLNHELATLSCYKDCLD